jgi:hypothetical protein
MISRRSSSTVSFLSSKANSSGGMSGEWRENSSTEESLPMDSLKPVM